MSSQQRESTDPHAPAGASHEGAHAPAAVVMPPAAVDHAAPAAAPHGKSRRPLYLAIAGVVLLLGGYRFAPLVVRAFNTVSTDDAYVNGHVTTVAARVPGQVLVVKVDDNNRVRKGDILVQLDKEPYEVQLAIKKTALESAQTDLVATQDRLRGIAAQARSNRFKLEHAMEDVRNQLALLKSNVAQLEAEKASLVLAEQDYGRGEALVGKGAISRQQFDQYKAARDVASSRVQSAEQTIQQTRASLGLPINRENPLDAPPNLDQTFSTVRQALADLLVSAAPLGITPTTYSASPKEVIDEFYKRDPEGNVDRIFAKLVEEAAPIKQAQSKVHEAQAALSQAELNLRYCDVFAEIDGVITRRNVNPGNQVQAGQALMAIRSLTDIWIDANFKETQLAELRIGQPVDVEVDMYGSRHHFRGRITGFTMGTGSTLALLPPQNATGNFVKVVQRLPVRIDLEDYDAENQTLFVGLSVIPYVYYKKPAEGPNAGKRLQEVLPTEKSS
ncbi:MAG TPA: HlyD family secretion protein [Pirellulales bacterium]|jgi:membrane fusion protein (multidrug efflux system)